MVILYNPKLKKVLEGIGFTTTDLHRPLKEFQVVGACA